MDCQKKQKEVKFIESGKLDTKHGSRQYQRSVKLNEIQKNNAKAAISRTDQGITLRIDNVGLDEGNLLLYYTVSLNKTTTAEKLEKVKKDSLQERWNLNRRTRGQIYRR